jgi:hypothetical protein
VAADDPDREALLTHLYDQSLGHLMEQAPLLARYYECLRASGMPEGPAMGLVLVTHLRMIGGLDRLVGGGK